MWLGIVSPVKVIESEVQSSVPCIIRTGLSGTPKESKITLIAELTTGGASGTHREDIKTAAVV